MKRKLVFTLLLLAVSIVAYNWIVPFGPKATISPGQAVKRISWPVTVFVPYLALLGMFIIVKGRGRLQKPVDEEIEEQSKEGETANKLELRNKFDRKIIELGTDVSILGIGVSAALLGTGEIKNALGDPVTVAVVILFIDIFIIGVSANLKDWELMNTRVRAETSIALAALILGINTSVVAFVNQDALSHAVIKGLWASLAPSMILWLAYFIRLKLSATQREAKQNAEPAE